MKISIKHRLSRFFPLLMVGVIGAAGCSGLKPQASPPGEAPISPTTPATPPVTNRTTAVYFSDWQAQHMIPEMRQLPQAEAADLATQVVNQILAGPKDPHLVRPIPTGVKLVESVTIQNGVANVNLSKEIQNVHGSAGVNANLNSLRLSLTEIPGITKVQLLIEGRKDIDLDGVVLEPMDRGFYDYPVLVNPARNTYLQDQFNQGHETWRADPIKVAQWEGRMFGFTQEELQGAKLTRNAGLSTVDVTRNGAIYTIVLKQNPVAQGQGIWTIQELDPLARHTLDILPAAVKDWAHRYLKTTIGVAHSIGNRTYLLAALEAGTVHIDSVTTEGQELVVHLTQARPGNVALASVTNVEANLPVVFRWKSEPAGDTKLHTSIDQLPGLQNPHRLAQATLTGKIVVLTPTPQQSVVGAIKITGYARHLFEANLVARLFNQQGHQVAKAFTTAGACCFDWGSFDFSLAHTAPPGTYVLELGNFSAKDGEWQAMIKLPLKATN